MRIENRKLPAWMGSILFHAILVLCVLYWFSSGPDRSMPGERTAVGSIVFQPRGDAKEPGTALPTARTADSEFVDIEKFAKGTVNVSLPISAPGQQQGANAGAGSVAGIVASFEHGTLSNAGQGNLAGETIVQMFGVQGKGTKFMYVFDRSDSMNGNRIRRAKAELIQSLDSLDSLHQFNIIFYNGESHPWRSGAVKRLVFATPAEKQGAVRFIEGMTALGGTYHKAPLLEAIAHRPDVIFLLTDGESQDDLKSGELEEIERINSLGRGAQINVIHFISGGLTHSESRSLQQLAEQNRGQYKCINVTE